MNGQHEEDREQAVGYLSPKPQGGYIVICLTCAAAGDLVATAPIYPVNIRPYRQTCGGCGKVLLEGPGPELFT